MASEKISEVMSEEQLDAVSGGTNMESVSLLQRIQTERLAPVHTRIFPGNERAAAKELAGILKDFGIHGRLFMNDTQENIYTYNNEVVSADEVIDILKKNQPTGVEV